MTQEEVEVFLITIYNVILAPKLETVYDKNLQLNESSLRVSNPIFISFSTFKFLFLNLRQVTFHFVKQFVKEKYFYSCQTSELGPGKHS